jgi:hypothetical protein
MDKTTLRRLLISTSPFISAPFVIGLALTLMPSQIAGQDCRQWDVAGNWALHQDNNINVNMILRQTRDQISGTAAYPGRKHVERGTVKGTLISVEYPRPGTQSITDFKESLHLEIKWDYGETGVYDGRVQYGLKLQGAAYIKEDRRRERETTWHSDDNVARCSKKK